MRKLFLAVSMLLLAVCMMVACNGSDLKLTLDKTKAEVEIGQTLELKATLTGGEEKISWSSSDDNTATVVGGKVTGISEGVVTITAKAGNAAASCEVTVKRGVTVGIEPKEAEMLTGTTLQLTVKIEGGSGNAEWSSSDPKKAEVDENGLVSAKAEGEVVITAKVGGKTAICKITVKTVSISFDKETETVYVNKTVKLVPSVINTTEKPVFKSENEKVAKVGEDGTVTGVSVGSTTITATVANKSATIAVDVKEPTLAFEADSFTVYMTKTFTLTVNKEGLDGEVTWKSEHQEIAAVENGVVTPVSVGKTKIIASCDGKTAECTVTVDSAKTVTLEKTHIKLDVSGKANEISEELAASVDGVPEPKFTVTSSDPAVVSAEGMKLTAVQKGTATVTVDFAGFTAECEVVVGDYNGYLVVRTAKQFKDAVNKEGRNFVLANDIDFGGEHLYIASKGVDYVFDGNGYAIKNFKTGASVDRFIKGEVEEENEMQYKSKGLFGYIGPAGVIRNLRVEQAELWLVYTGSLFGIHSQGLIENVYANVDVYRRYNWPWDDTAVLIARNDETGIVRNCVVEAHSKTQEEFKNYVTELGMDASAVNFNVFGDVADGANMMQGILVGRNFGKVENCYAVSVENDPNIDIFNGQLGGVPNKNTDNVEVDKSCALKTLEELKDESLYGDSWDKSVWKVKKGELPALHNNNAVAPEIVEIYETDGTFTNNKLQLRGAINTANELVWSSEDDAIASVDANGLVTAKGVGNVKITATAKNGTASASVYITVEMLYTDSINEIVDGKNYKLQFTQLGSEMIVWTSANESVLAVQDGTVRGIGAGTAAVIATVNGKKYAREITVKVASVSVDVDEFSGYTGETFELNPQAANMSAEFSYSTDAENIVEIDAKTGKVTLKAEGSVVITVTATEGDVVRTATCKVTVLATPAFTLDRESATLDKGGVAAADKFTLGVVGADGVAKEFTSENEQVATVSPEGVVTAVGAGSTVISVKAGGGVRECKITVKDFTGYSAVSTTEQFLAMKNGNYDVPKNFVLTSDIDFQGAYVANIGLMVGTIDGNGHTVKNFVFGYESFDAFLAGKNKVTKGLFDAVWDEAQTNIRNINFTGIKAYLGYNTGILASYNYGVFENIYMQAEVYVRDAWNYGTGLLAGRNCDNAKLDNRQIGKIKNCIVVASCPMTEEQIVEYAVQKGIVNGENGKPFSETGWVFCKGQDGTQGLICGENKGTVQDCFAVSADPYDTPEDDRVIFGRLNGNNQAEGESGIKTEEELKTHKYNDTWDRSVWDIREGQTPCVKSVTDAVPVA